MALSTIFHERYSTMQVGLESEHWWFEIWSLNTVDMMPEIFSRKLNGDPISSIYLLSIFCVLYAICSFLFWCHCCSRKGANGHCRTAVQLPKIFRTISNVLFLPFFSDGATRLSPTLWGYEADWLFSKRLCFPCHYVKILKQKTAKDYWASQAILSGRFPIPVSKISMSVSHMNAQFHCSI